MASSHGQLSPERLEEVDTVRSVLRKGGGVPDEPIPSIYGEAGGRNKRQYYQKVTKEPEHAYLCMERPSGE